MFVNWDYHSGVFYCIVATVLVRNVLTVDDFRPYIIVENGRPKVLARHLEELTQGFRFVGYFLVVAAAN